MGSSEKRERGGEGEALTASPIGSHVLDRQSLCGPQRAQTGLGGNNRKLIQLSQVFIVRATQRQAAAWGGKSRGWEGGAPISGVLPATASAACLVGRNLCGGEASGDLHQAPAGPPPPATPRMALWLSGLEPSRRGGGGGVLLTIGNGLSKQRM